MGLGHGRFRSSKTVVDQLANEPQSYHAYDRKAMPAPFHRLDGPGCRRCSERSLWDDDSVEINIIGLGTAGLWAHFRFGGVLSLLSEP
jgi:hypothetical protein